MKLSRPPRRRLVFLSGVAPILITAALAIYRPPFFARLEAATYDVVVRAAATNPPAGRVAIVTRFRKCSARSRSPSAM